MPEARKLTFRMFFIMGLLSVSSVVSQAEDSFFDIGFGAASYVGTAGVGVQGNVSLNDYLGIVGGLDWGGWNFNFQDKFGQAIIEDGNVNLGVTAPYVMGAIHPFGNDFRLAGGLAYANLAGVGSFKYSGASYQGDFDVTIENSQKLSPVVTLGFAHDPRGGLGVYLEGGVIFSGGLKASVKSSDICGGNAVCDYERQATSGLIKLAADELVNFYPGNYPILRLGLRYSF